MVEEADREALLAMYLESQKQYEEMNQRYRNMQAPVNAAIYAAFSNSSDAAAVIEDKTRALEFLRHGNAECQYGALLALTFCHHEASNAFKEELLGLVRNASGSKVQTLAVTALGNVCREAKDPIILAELSTLLHRPHSDQRFTDAVALAIAQVSCTLPTGERLRAIREYKEDIESQRASARSKAKELRDKLGSGFALPSDDPNNRKD